MKPTLAALLVVVLLAVAYVLFRATRETEPLEPRAAQVEHPAQDEEPADAAALVPDASAREDALVDAQSPDPAETADPREPEEPPAPAEPLDWAAEYAQLSREELDLERARVSAELQQRKKAAQKERVAAGEYELFFHDPAEPVPISDYHDRTPHPATTVMDTNRANGLIEIKLVEYPPDEYPEIAELAERLTALGMLAAGGQ